MSKVPNCTYVDSPTIRRMVISLSPPNKTDGVHNENSLSIFYIPNIMYSLELLKKGSEYVTEQCSVSKRYIVTFSYLSFLNIFLWLRSLLAVCLLLRLYLYGSVSKLLCLN